MPFIAVEQRSLEGVPDAPRPSSVRALNNGQVEVHLKSRDARQTVTEASPGAGRERSLVWSGLGAPVSEHFQELARVERESNLRDAVRGEFAHPVGLKAR